MSVIERLPIIKCRKILKNKHCKSYTKKELNWILNVHWNQSCYSFGTNLDSSESSKQSKYDDFFRGFIIKQF